MSKKRLGRRRRRFQEALKTQRAQTASRGGHTIKIGYWNANGLHDQDKKRNIVDKLKSKDIKIMCIAETHIRIGNHDDLSMFEEYRVIQNERGYTQKSGGGMLVLINQDLRPLMYKPVDEDFPETSTERAWVLVHEAKSKVAVAFVYMAAQVPGTDAYKEWNRRVYCSLQRDLDKLTEAGYRCMIMGDFNGHMGVTMFV